MAEKLAAAAWLSVRSGLMSTGAFQVAADRLRSLGFSASEFRMASRQAIADSLTAAEDYLETKRPRETAIREQVKAARRRCEA